MSVQTVTTGVTQRLSVHRQHPVTQVWIRLTMNIDLRWTSCSNLTITFNNWCIKQINTVCTTLVAFLERFISLYYTLLCNYSAFILKTVLHFSKSTFQLILL